MNDLVIKLTGEIQNSNFNEWKNSLLVQINSVNEELKSDEDFVVATENVKTFKIAEKTLKEAKQSAIEQATDIQNLFSAIDEVSEKTRQVRLSLDRQIKFRKEEIKEELVASEIEIINNLINEQSDDFKLIDCSSFLDKNRFKLAIKGKVNLSKVEEAAKDLCNTIKKEIIEKVEEVKNSGITIDNLSGIYKLLFQDRKSLVSLNKQELDLTIEKRIALFNEENTKLKAEETITNLKKREELELNPQTNPDNKKENLTKENYKLTINISATKEKAIEMARSIRENYENNEEVSSIKLSREGN